MENSIFVGLSRQIALREQMDIISNNVANMSTPGYRSQNMVFTEFIDKPSRAPDTETNDPLSMVLDYGHYQVTAPGSIRQTGNTLDVAMEGPGYFGIQTPDGVMYTRAGNFQMNVNGELVTGTGNLVADAGGGTITIPQEATDIKITKNGSITTSEGEVAQLMVVEFENVQELEAMGNGLYKTDAAANPAEQTRVLQGMLEDSNVNSVLEMTRMIDVLRAYQTTQRMMQGEHERQRTMIQRLSRSN